MRQTLRIILAVVFGIFSCGLVIGTLLVARNSWLALGQITKINYALFNLLDKALVLLGGIISLAFLIYSLEMYTNAEAPIGVLHQFLRLTVPILYILAVSHLIISYSAFRFGMYNTMSLLLPLGELLLAMVLRYLDRKYVLSRAVSADAPNLT